MWNIQSIQLINWYNLLMLVIPHLQHHHTRIIIQYVIFILNRSLHSLSVLLKLKEIKLSDT